MMEKKLELLSYNNFLLKGEIDIPVQVKKTISFFETKKLWFQLSRNLEARSCRDAANKRNRLGHIGIPLHDELKSYLGIYENLNGKLCTAMLHCRGNQELDMHKVKAVLNSKAEITRISSDEMNNRFGLEYGTVNPFMVSSAIHSNKIIQIFDGTVFNDLLPPYTMMTNAGDLSWGIEFMPRDLLNSLRSSFVADIIDAANSEPLPIQRHKIGIITGNSPDSGIHLWQEVNKIIRDTMKDKFQGDISYPPVIIESIPELGYSMELERRYSETEKSILKIIDVMIKEDATIICIACNTTQYFTPKIKELCEPNNVKFISIPEVTLQYVVEHNIHEFAFLGIKYVTDFDKWSAFKILKKYKVEFLNQQTLDKIDELAYSVKQGGAKEKDINGLRDLLNKTVKSKNVVIALTELSILFKKQKKKGNTERRYIDTLDLLAQAIANDYLKKTYPTMR